MQNGVLTSTIHMSNHNYWKFPMAHPDAF